MDRPLTPRDRARQLRRDQTEAEALLWMHLRRKSLEGVKFRRQFPVGVFIADFCAPSALLIVEVDGGQHDEQAQRDRRRTLILESNGYRVLRFWNNEVMSNLDGVLEVIRAALIEARAG